MRLVLLSLLALLAAACAPGPGDAAAGDLAAAAPSSGAGPAAGADPATGGELVVEIDRGNGGPVERYTLTCGGTDAGDHPDAAAACAHLRSMADPFAPIPADAVCTEVYGGPQTAHVTGTWRGQPVDLRLSRVDGCRIAQWDGLGPLLPGPVGVEPLD